MSEENFTRTLRSGGISNAKYCLVFKKKNWETQVNTVFYGFICLFLTLHPLKIHANVTDPVKIGMLYRTMQIVDQILHKEGITYWVNGGALLGAFRHGTLIPWDQDIDIEFHEEDINRLLSLKEVFKEHGLYLLEIGPTQILYRIHKDYYDHNGKLEQAIVELYPTYISEDGKVCLRYSLFTHHYEKSYWYPQDLAVISRIPFGPIEIDVAASSKAYITRYYGDKALEQADIFHPGLQEFTPAVYIWPDDSEFKKR